MKRWIRDIKLSRKLMAIVLAALVPIVLLTFLFLRSEQSKIDTARLELAGLAAYDPVENMLEPLADMQMWAVAHVAGDPLAKDKMQSARARIDQLTTKRGTAAIDYGAPAGEDARRWGEIQRSWSALSATQFASTAAVNTAYSVLRDQLLDLGNYVAATSGLVLDPDPVNYFVIMNTTGAVPEFESRIANMRAAAAAIGASGTASKAQLSEVVRAQALTEDAVRRIRGHMESAAMMGERGQQLRTAMDSDLEAAEKSFSSFSTFVNSTVINSTISAPLDDVIAKADGIMKAVVQLHGSLVDSTGKQLESTVATTTRTRNEMLLLVLLALGASVAFTYLVATSTTGGLNAAVVAVQRLAEGDYSSEIDAPGRDELGQMLQALKQMQVKVASVLASVKESAATVATAARQINAGTMDLTGRTEQQAANLEETASSMEEMTATVKQNADNARLANQLAQAARDQAEHGGSVVEQAVAAMSAIDGSSKKIADIISVIDEIAFQTNLLALNAAVEAARAGDQGRGFAVVASEVRSLAQRSASAAKEIKGLIHDSVGKVEEGGRLVSESGRHLAEIVASVKKVSDVVGEITSASQEQAVSAEEIGRAVMQMDEGTQQNAAMVEETSAAAASMNEQASKLAQLTGFFRLNGAAAAAVALPPVHAEKAQQPVKAKATSAPKAPLAGRERRATGRPWSKRPATLVAGGDAGATAAAATSVARPSALARRAAGDAASDGDWSEF